MSCHLKMKYCSFTIKNIYHSTESKSKSSKTSNAFMYSFSVFFSIYLFHPCFKTICMLFGITLFITYLKDPKLLPPKVLAHKCFRI